MLTGLFLLAGLALIGLSTLPSLAGGTFFMFMAMAMLGMGNGAVFQLVPLRFPKEIGVTTGLIGAAGGLGGFFLPTILGAIKQTTGSFGPGFLTFAIVGGLGGAAVLTYASRSWKGIFIETSGKAKEIDAPAHSLFPEPQIA
jgi:NNP family nitrate/nitrite transporter-like MFS transporter